MSQNSKYLEKNGWTRISSVQRGMFKIQRWHHPVHGVWNQEFAIIHQRAANKAKKAVAK